MAKTGDWIFGYISGIDECGLWLAERIEKGEKITVKRFRAFALKSFVNLPYTESGGDD